VTGPHVITSAVAERIDGIVARAVEDGQAPGIVAGVSRGDDVHVAVAGSMALDGAPMRRDSLFRIASITKPMTAAALLALVQEGLVDLEEPVDRLLPELAERRVLRRPDAPLNDTEPAARPILVRELLTFTWGFGMQGAMFLADPPWPILTATQERELNTLGPPHPGSTPDPDTWMARFAELPLITQPGERWLYQSGSQVLGVLAARAAGTSFEEVLHTRLLAPLGMADTAFHAVDVDRLVTAYQWDGGQLEVLDPPGGEWARPPLFADGGAGLVSSVDDELAFGRMLLRGGSGPSGPVLTADTVTEMTRDHLTPQQRGRVWPGFDLLDGRGWGLGVSVLPDGRYSWDGGLGTSWSNVPADDLTVVVLTQRAWDETGPPAVCDAVLTAAREPSGR
jgi:CubicO group peptidase (beta-lactamase class C family)